jgi:hypothetical protein
MTLLVCPWCEEVDYEESDDEDDDDEVEFGICADCLFEFDWYFVLDDVEIFEFLREIDMFSEFSEEN